MQRDRFKNKERPERRPPERPPLRVFPTTLWEYPSQHYDAWVDDEGNLHKSKASGGIAAARARHDDAPALDSGPARGPQGRAMQGDKAYVGATPAWVIWQLLIRYTRENDLVVDPMCGSGTTIDVARDLGRRGLGYDLAPSRPDLFRADARKLPLEDGKVDFFFVDPPYSTHIDYSDDPACIGKLDAGGTDGGSAYYTAMDKVFAEAHRVMKNRRYMAVYVSDSWRKKGKGEGAGGEFMPIAFELFALLRKRFAPVDIISVVRHNQKLARGNWRKAAEEGNFYLRGFNYLMIFKKQA